ncbi:hypothetical protein EMA8858_04147 [Emticicia aquatica]|uniref:DUF4435 domain-containing protein n=1 Tax=Emticicia aquatica TaxID=1681835 RepID=A0ABM9AWU5_9BACT|nr:DUF4435 domain-containing protein [Emticicia aquatica]CAH0998012.1 hypothetical protein EMA8858_04147 [Emticicia aquatica]
MELVDKLRLEASSGHVAYTEFILKLKRRTDSLFCFFEGKDDFKYYGVRIQSATKKDFESIVCEGKENVISVKRLIDSKKEYKKVLTSYFIDQDYESAIKIKKVYCLPSYSIENQYCNKYVLQKILKHEFSIEDDDKDYETVQNLFVELQTKFHRETLFLNSWLACQSDKRKDNGIQNYLHIDSTVGSLFTNIINQNLEFVLDLECINSIEKLKSYFPHSTSISEEELNNKIIFFEKRNKEIEFRGKFELRLFISFLDRLKSEICKKQSTVFEKKHKCSLRFEYATFLTNLSIYANTPKCLLEYLDEIIKEAA